MLELACPCATRRRRRQNPAHKRAPPRSRQITLKVRHSHPRNCVDRGDTPALGHAAGRGGNFIDGCSLSTPRDPPTRLPSDPEGGRLVSLPTRDLAAGFTRTRRYERRVADTDNTNARRDVDKRTIHSTSRMDLYGLIIARSWVRPHRAHVPDQRSWHRRIVDNRGTKAMGWDRELLVSNDLS